MPIRVERQSEDYQERAVELLCYGIRVRLSDPDERGRYRRGSIASCLIDELGPLGAPGRAAVNVLESLIVAHAVAGIDVASPAYVEGLETVVETIAQDLSNAEEEDENG